MPRAAHGDGVFPRHALAAEGDRLGAGEDVRPPPPAPAAAEVQPARHAQRRPRVHRAETRAGQPPI
eukprot:1187724-Prorocentrum_minimum.AAC.4